MPNFWRRRTPLSAYNIADVGTNEAEINLYGEIVEKPPVDWFGDEQHEGFIILSDFMESLENLVGKAKITVHINSVGGDLLSGIAIYNRLRTLGAEIVTINDSLAASAGSVIYMAGDVRRIYPSAAVMVHHALLPLFGMYNAKDFASLAADCANYDRQLVGVYRERTGLPEETILAHMDAEQWMVGEEAVRLGYADEVIAGETPAVEESATPGVLNVGRLRVAAHWMPPLPGQQPKAIEPERAPETVSTPAPPDEDNTTTTGGKSMEITTVEQLREAYPELVQQLEEAAREAGRQEGAQAEEERLQEIDEVAGSIEEEETVKAAKYGAAKCSASEMLLRNAKARAAAGAKVSRSMAQETAAASAVKSMPAPAEKISEADEAVALMRAAAQNINDQRKAR